MRTKIQASDDRAMRARHLLLTALLVLATAGLVLIARRNADHNYDGTPATETVTAAATSRHGAAAWLFLVAALLALASATFFLFLRPASDDNGASLAAAGPSPTATRQPEATSQVAEEPDTVASPAPEATPFVGVDIARIVVPDLDINAPIVTRGVDANGTMEVPDGPTDVAWYTFSALPGEGSNVVLAGHLDYVNYGPAVFYHIKDAKPGEEVRLELVDGTTAVYHVLDVTTYDEATAPVQQIVGPTDGDIVTLITCGGSFDRASREYDKRVVVRAERVDTTARAP
jgi:LPXTG-site transpeptidase (sortase) family protein